MATRELVVPKSMPTILLMFGRRALNHEMPERHVKWEQLHPLVPICERFFTKPKFDTSVKMVFNRRVRDENELSDNQVLRAHSRHDGRMAAPLRVFW